MDRGAVTLDLACLGDHPLPEPDPQTDKNGRGRVLAVGGCREVPGGIALTVEAALRAGAGKVRLATITSAALTLGIAMPEIAVVALGESADGHIANLDALAKSEWDAMVAGPAMSCHDGCSALAERLLGFDDGHAALILDAALLMALPRCGQSLKTRSTHAVLTPHIGEMAAMLECDVEAIKQDGARAAREAADRFGAVVVFKGATNWIATPEGQLFRYSGGSVGLATGGSGDVLAGIAAGLAARGVGPLSAALWSVWLHGEAGRVCSATIGPLGFLARDLPLHVPALMAAAAATKRVAPDDS
ncbi:NAD(P)H-hydrate dehydratase [Novosphingobium terrae]|uniref:NAD(P)H-hydrate dehydratase n=1 Tax=Novosphingobium terrae TaxID=2726189 RepID=UPI001F138DF0|nr:NAD(P)H-hydrate dehydratase [Novosphingobium terrae]